MSGLVETRPIERDGDALVMSVYGQDGRMVRMRVADTPSNRLLIVWLRQHDRYTPHDQGRG